MTLTRHPRGWRPSHRPTAAAPAPVMPPGWTPPRKMTLAAPPLLDQGNTGDCTAYTTCQCGEALPLREGKPVGERSSRLYTYGKTRLDEGCPLDDDNGASVADAFAALERWGACPMSAWDDATHRFSDAPTSEADLAAAQHKSLLTVAHPTLPTILASIAQGFPVGFGASFAASMMDAHTAATGIVRMPSDDDPATVFHSVALFGYDLDATVGDETGFGLAPNHWGTSWGQVGWFWFPLRYFSTGLASDAHSIRRVMEAA